MYIHIYIHLLQPAQQRSTTNTELSFRISVSRARTSGACSPSALKLPKKKETRKKKKKNNRGKKNSKNPIFVKPPSERRTFSRGREGWPRVIRDRDSVGYTAGTRAQHVGVIALPSALFPRPPRRNMHELGGLQRIAVVVESLVMTNACPVIGQSSRKLDHRARGRRGRRTLIVHSYTHPGRSVICIQQRRYGMDVASAVHVCVSRRGSSSAGAR